MEYGYVTKLLQLGVVDAEEAAGEASTDGGIKVAAGFLVAAKAQQEVYTGGDIVGILGLELDGLLPVVEGGIILLEVLFQGGTRGIGDGGVGLKLHYGVQLVESFCLAPHLLQDIGQRHAGFGMMGKETEEGLIVMACCLVMAQMGGGIGPIEQGCGVLHLVFEDEAILIDGILPLVELQVYGGLAQMEVGVPGRSGYLLVEDGERVAPVLGMQLLRQNSNKQAGQN